MKQQHITIAIHPASAAIIAVAIVMSVMLLPQHANSQPISLEEVNFGNVNKKIEACKTKDTTVTEQALCIAGHAKNRRENCNNTRVVVVNSHAVLHANADEDIRLLCDVKAEHLQQSAITTFKDSCVAQLISSSSATERNRLYKQGITEQRVSGKRKSRFSNTITRNCAHVSGTQLGQLYLHGLLLQADEPGDTTLYALADT